MAGLVPREIPQSCCKGLDEGFCFLFTGMPKFYKENRKKDCKNSHSNLSLGNDLLSSWDSDASGGIKQGTVSLTV